MLISKKNRAQKLKCVCVCMCEWDGGGGEVREVTHIPRQEVAETPVIFFAVEQVLYFWQKK